MLAGITSFDCADHYGPAEVLIGRYLQSHPAAAAPKSQVLTKYCVFSGVDMATINATAVEKVRLRHLPSKSSHTQQVHRQLLRCLQICSSCTCTINCSHLCSDHLVAYICWLILYMLTTVPWVCAGCGHVSQTAWPATGGSHAILLARLRREKVSWLVSSASPPLCQA